MATRREATMRRLAGMGIGGVRPARGARALETCFARAVVCFAAFDLKALALSARHLHRAFMSELVVVGADRSRLDAFVRDAPPPKTPPRPVAKTTTTTASSFDDVKTTTSTIVARALGTTIDDDAPLMQHGLDSLSAIDLAAAVGTRFAVDAPSTLFFDHPTVRAVARFVARRLDVDKRATSPNESASASASASAVIRPLEDVAEETPRETPRIVVFAGESRLDVDAVTPTPLARERDAYEGAANAFAGFIPTFERLAKFDAYAFGPASSSELATLDPRQRLTLDAAAACARSRALDDDGDRRDDTTPAGDTGVYVGCAGKDYALLLRVHGVHHDAFKGIGNESSVVSGRVSFVFAFRGPSVSVDCACSSSLVAAVVALDGFELGASTLTRAFIAGASLVLTDDMHRVLGGAGMLSPCGRCRTFDRAADGYGRGEAVETLVASSRARDGAGGGTYLASGRVNQDGRSSSLTAPNGNAQRAVIRLAMTRASTKGLAFDDVTVHAHGTGTALGDPIETRASTDALSARRHSSRVPTLTFQSSKSWSGHTEPASGALTLVAAHVQVSRERLSRAVCHLRAVSPHVENPSIRDAHTVFPRETARGTFARVNVHANAFAFQGTNAHVVTASTTMGDFEPRAAKPTTHARRFWPTRAREILAVETRRARFIFTTSHAPTTFSNALAVRAAFERAFDDDAFALARFVSRSVDAAEDRGTRGNGEGVLLTVRVEADAASSSACVARARRRPVVVERVRRLFGALARAPSNRAATERVARARGFASAFDVTVAACEAMTATRDVDSNARLVVVETACGGTLVCERRRGRRRRRRRAKKNADAAASSDAISARGVRTRARRRRVSSLHADDRARGVVRDDPRARRVHVRVSFGFGGESSTFVRRVPVRRRRDDGVSMRAKRMCR